MAMLRLADEAALKALLAKGRVREARGFNEGAAFRITNPAEVEHPKSREHITEAIARVSQPPPTTAPTAPLPKAVKKRVSPGDKDASEIEVLFAQQIQIQQLPIPIREYHHLRGSAHRLDFAWPDWRYNGMQIGVEVQGHVHRIRERFHADLEKRAKGLLQDWAILEVGGRQVRNGLALAWLVQIFERAKGPSHG